MTKPNSWKHGKLVMLILSISFLISITPSCSKSQIEFVPFESHKFIIQKLPNGNYEVKPDMIIEYQKVLLTGIKYKLKYEAAQAIIDGRTND